MRRWLFGGLVFAVCAVPVVAGSLEIPANPRTQPMQFVRQQEGPAAACGAACRELIFASGMITTDSARRLEAFVREHGIQGATVVLDSDGGSVRGALSLGRVIRAHGLSTTVGRPAAGRATTGTTHGATAIAPATCESMCAFVMLGGVHRDVPAKSRVLVHQIWLGDRRDDAVAASYSAEDLVLVQRDIGQIVRYTADMGGSAELIELSLRIPPWEPMRALSRDELQRAGLDLPAEPGEPTPPAAFTPISTMSADPPGQLSDRGWTLADGSNEQTVLARRHPLTYEGERIGSFDLVLACGDQPGTYAITYADRRTAGTATANPPAVDQVRMWIGDSELAFQVVSSGKNGGDRQIETVATAAAAATLVRAFAGQSNRSLAVVTHSGADQPATMIRIGNSGLAKSFPQFEAACGERSRPRLDAHAHLDPRTR